MVIESYPQLAAVILLLLTILYLGIGRWLIATAHMQHPELRKTSHVAQFLFVLSWPYFTFRG